MVIADEIEFTLEDDFDWSRLTVKIPESRATATLDILRRIPKQVIREKQEAIAETWKMVTWKNPPEEGDALEFVLRQLGRKGRRNFKASSYTFWATHGPTIDPMGID